MVGLLQIFQPPRKGSIELLLRRKALHSAVCCLTKLCMGFKTPKTLIWALFRMCFARVRFLLIFIARFHFFVACVWCLFCSFSVTDRFCRLLLFPALVCTFWPTVFAGFRFLLALVGCRCLQFSALFCTMQFWPRSLDPFRSLDLLVISCLR